MIKLSVIKTKLSENQGIFENFLFLSLTQLFNFLYPLITYPYLIKTLGATMFGSVVFAQSLCSFFSLMIDWGFEATGTKEISIHRNDKQKLSQIISTIMITKFFLWITLFFFFLVMIYFIPFLHQYQLLYIFTFFLTFNELLLPIWYFQGIEKMKYITYLTIVIKCIFLIAIFLFIHQPDDYLYVPLLNAIGIFIGGLIALFIMIVKHKNNFSFQPISQIILYLKDGLPIFISNIAVAVKDRFNTLFIGTFLGMTDVAIYDLATKIMNIFMQLIVVANNAIYPKVAKQKNMQFVRQFIYLSLIGVISLIILIQPFLPFMLDFLSKGLTGTLLPTEILLLSPIILAVSVPLARNCLIVFGLYNFVLKNCFFTTIFYLLLIFGTYILVGFNAVYQFTIIAVLTYLFEITHRLYFCQKQKFFK